MTSPSGEGASGTSVRSISPAARWHTRRKSEMRPTTPSAWPSGNAWVAKRAATPARGDRRRHAQPVHVDAEPFRVARCTVEILPHALRLLVPPSKAAKHLCPPISQVKDSLVVTVSQLLTHIRTSWPTIKPSPTSRSRVRSATSDWRPPATAISRSRMEVAVARGCDVALRCAAFATTALDGDQVVVHGAVSLYEAQGKMQFYADHLEMAGVGRFYQDFEALKARLGAEGLFDARRSGPSPPWPRRVRDRDFGASRCAPRRCPHAGRALPGSKTCCWRCPRCRASRRRRRSWPRSMRSTSAASWTWSSSRAAAAAWRSCGLSTMSAWRAPLWPEAPVICGVGHETDFTLADFAADVRAPTPTGAAALAVPDRLDLASQAASCAAGCVLLGEASRRRAAAPGSDPPSVVRLSPQTQIAGRRQQVDDWARRWRARCGSACSFPAWRSRTCRPGWSVLTRVRCFCVVMRSSNKRPQAK